MSEEIFVGQLLINQSKYIYIRKDYFNKDHDYDDHWIGIKEVE